MKGIITILFLCICANFFGQTFADFRSRYDHLGENDEGAFTHISSYIHKARTEKNYPELTQAYKDAVYFSRKHKISYADSAISAALRSGDRDLAATAFMTKGAVYYFIYKKFKPALDQFMKAWEYSHNSKDEYLYYKNLYYIGVVKSYLGSYEEAARIFKESNCFFWH